MVGMRFGVAIVLVAATSLLRAAEVEKSTHMVAMRDGTKLATDVIIPKGANGPLPVVFARGPYGKAGVNFLADTCAERGYILVSQDMRGRFDSEGSDAVVFHNDGWGKNQDGHDALTWIASQEWCNGSIVTTGASALGITQNLMAVDAAPALKAQDVFVAFSDMYSDCAYQGGVWRKELIETWLVSQKFDEESLQTFRAHPRYDEFWTEMNTEAEADRAHAPAIFRGGWYDIFTQGTIDSFTALQTDGQEPARGDCRLIMGPWAHGTFDELKYPANSNDMPKAGDAFRFFDHWAKGAENGVEDDAPVHYYVMGDPTDAKAPGNVWRSADSWPPPATDTAFYFHADGTLTRDAASEGDAKLSYKYDPSNPVPSVGGQNLTILKGPMDQRMVESRDDVLLFTTDVLAEPLEVTGRILATLHVASDCPDTDFTVKLCDVYPDGRSMLVTDGILRARYHESFEKETYLEPGKPIALEVDLWSTSLVFNAGHRIRIAVSSSNSPRFEPNPNTGADGGEPQVATNTLFVSATQPSHITLPVFSGK